MTRYIIYLSFFLLLGMLSCTSAPMEGRIDQAADTEDAFEVAAFSLSDIENLPVSSFGEVWAYLLSGREETFQSSFPISDLGYFGAEVDTYGKLINVPDPQKIADFSGRVHMVVTCNNYSLSHFVLEPESEVRRQLITDLLAAADSYDGLQIDFEMIPARDGDTFISFLWELRNGLQNKMFTIALPARTRTIENNVYNYAKIAPIVDRILVMAYDEHWSTSKPGPIASMEWCNNVAKYAQSVIEPEKLIMGIPFYGRTWGDYSTNRAFLNSGIEQIKRDNGVTEVERLDGVPYFSFEIPITITTFYEDDVSLSIRMEMYKSMGVKAIGFWCLGQESPTFWNYLRLE